MIDLTDEDLAGFAAICTEYASFHGTLTFDPEDLAKLANALAELERRRELEASSPDHPHPLPNVDGITKAITALKMTQAGVTNPGVWIQCAIDFLENDPEVMAEGKSYADPAPPKGGTTT